jgi:hypothetical protein
MDRPPQQNAAGKEFVADGEQPRAVRGDLGLTLPRHQGNIDRALEPFRGTDGAHDSAGQRAAVRTVAAGEEARRGFPKRMASGAVSHLAGEEEEQFFVLEVGEERGTQHDERAGVRAEGVGVPLLITGNINVGHFGQAKNARSENGLLPDFGQLFGAEANAVEGGFDPRAADFVGGGAHDGVECGNLLQPGHRLAVLCPQEDGAIELVAGIERAQPATSRADDVGGFQASAAAAADFADGRWLGDCIGRWRGSGDRCGRRLHLRWGAGCSGAAGTTSAVPQNLQNLDPGVPAPCPCGQTGNAALLAMGFPWPPFRAHARPSATSKLNSEEFEYSTRFPQDRGKKIARFLVCPVRNRPG